MYTWSCVHWSYGYVIVLEGSICTHGHPFYKFLYMSRDGLKCVCAVCGSCVDKIIVGRDLRVSERSITVAVMYRVLNMLVFYHISLQSLLVTTAYST